jgi:hypothetical protein
MLLIAVLVCIAVVGNASGNISTFMAFSAGAVLFSVFTFFVVARIESHIHNKRSIWLQPTSERVSKTVINSVVLLWLCFVGLVVAVILKAANSLSVTAGTIVILLIGFVYGWYLKRHFASHSLLMYGVSYVGALILILIFVNEIASPTR